MQPLGGVGVVSLFPSTITFLLEDFLTPYHSLPIIGNFLRINYLIEFENKLGKLYGKMGGQVSISLCVRERGRERVEREKFLVYVDGEERKEDP